MLKFKHCSNSVHLICSWSLENWLVSYLSQFMCSINGTPAQTHHSPAVLAANPIPCLCQRMPQGHTNCHWNKTQITVRMGKWANGAVVPKNEFDLLQNFISASAFIRCTSARIRCFKDTSKYSKRTYSLYIHPYTIEYGNCSCRL